MPHDLFDIIDNGTTRVKNEITSTFKGLNNLLSNTVVMQERNIDRQARLCLKEKNDKTDTAKCSILHPLLSASRVFRNCTALQMGQEMLSARQ